MCIYTKTALFTALRRTEAPGELLICCCRARRPGDRPGTALLSPGRARPGRRAKAGVESGERSSTMHAKGCASTEREALLAMRAFSRRSSVWFRAVAHMSGRWAEPRVFDTSGFSRFRSYKGLVFKQDQNTLAGWARLSPQHLWDWGSDQRHLNTADPFLQIYDGQERGWWWGVGGEVCGSEETMENECLWCTYQRTKTSLLFPSALSSLCVCVCVKVKAGADYRAFCTARLRKAFL